MLKAHKQFAKEDREISLTQEQVKRTVNDFSVNSEKKRTSQKFRIPKRQLKVHSDGANLK